MDIKKRKGKNIIVYKRKRQRGELLNFIFEKGRLTSIGYTVLVFAWCIVPAFFWGIGVINSWVAFLLAYIPIVVRFIENIWEKTGDDKYWVKREHPTFFKWLYSFFQVLLIIELGSLLNLIFMFQFWWRIGIAKSWIQELQYSITLVLFILPTLGGYFIFIEQGYFFKPQLERLTKYQKRKLEQLGEKWNKKWQKRVRASLIFGYSMLFIVIPIILIFTLFFYIGYYDRLTYGGVLSSTSYKGEFHNKNVYKGQAIEDWFGYVFYIVFQSPPAGLMIAFMGISSIAVILSQNLARVGRLVSGVAMGIIAIVPMLIVISAIGGGIPPPPELEEVIGLSYAVASFIHGLALMLTYIIMVSIMATFIASSRALALDFIA